MGLLAWFDSIVAYEPSPEPLPRPKVKAHWDDQTRKYDDWFEQELVSDRTSRVVARIKCYGTGEPWHVYVDGDSLGEFRDYEQAKRHAEANAFKE